MATLPDPTSPGDQRTVADLGERALIDRIRTLVPDPPSFVPIGIGDDAAVVEPERNTLDVLTADALVEGVHFDRRFSDGEDVGHKALAVNLSDLAAMGATPRVALLSLVLPPDTPVAFFDGLLKGLLALAARARTSLVGGNITRSPSTLVVDVTAVGSVRRRRVLTRAGARVGDEVWVSGAVGGGAAGLAWLQASTQDQVDAGASAADVASCILHHRRPEPRLRRGSLLGRNRAATACVDLSDGLGDAVWQIASASGVGIRLEAGEIPIEAGARRWWESREQDPLPHALGGSDDYELLFTVPKKARGRFAGVRRLIGDLAVTKIGVVTAERTITMVRAGGSEPVPRGFVHFDPAG